MDTLEDIQTLRQRNTKVHTITRIQAYKYIQTLKHRCIRVYSNSKTQAHKSTLHQTLRHSHTDMQEYIQTQHRHTSVHTSEHTNIKTQTYKSIHRHQPRIHTVNADTKAQVHKSA